MEIKKNIVGSPIKKKDAEALVTGKQVYTDDLAPKDCLIVKVLRSPYAHALIQEVDATKALAVSGIEVVLTWEDMPKKRFTMAGQTYPELSPYDRLILDQRVRFVGDAVAIVAGETEQCVDRALNLIKVKYEVLDAIIDMHEAMDHSVLIHPEEDWEAKCPVGGDNKRNLCASERSGDQEIDEIFKQCDIVLERTYHTKANQQAMMETFRTFTNLDTYGRLVITSSTQVPFHVRRILANALDIPKSRVRVIKPRVGGGFGAKQTVVAEVYPAIVTLKTGKPAKIVYSRYESQIASSPRHEMELTVRLGATKEGIFEAIDIYTLSNTGAYGEHGPTTVGLSGHKSIPLYRTPKSYRFGFDVVYTNTMSAGAYRGYGATQGIFALESLVSELAQTLNIDPVTIREMNMVRQGDVMPAYYGETATSCTLNQCMEKAKEMMNWKEKYPCKDMVNGKIRAVGVAMAMQGSAIAGVDVASTTLKLNDDGFYTLMIGAADMGTGCDTTLSQIAADCLSCSVDNIIVHGVDTDVSPYDSGSYASSTAYLTGMATVKTCETLIKKIIDKGASYLDCAVEDVDFDGTKVFTLDGSREITLVDIGNQIMCNNEDTLEACETHTSPVSPPPFMVGMAEIELDQETYQYELLDYVAVVDCGTALNPNLVRIQIEGGLAQGIGMAMYEDVTRSASGQVYENSLMQYKIPSRLDVGNLRVTLAESYEPTGPFGAKSIGEVVINTPPPAIAAAVATATGVWIRELPITPEKVFKASQK